MNASDRPETSENVDVRRTDFQNPSVRHMIHQVQLERLGNWERLLSPRHWGVEMANES